MGIIVLIHCGSPAFPHLPPLLYHFAGVSMHRYPAKISPARQFDKRSQYTRLTGKIYFMPGWQGDPSRFATSIQLDPGNTLEHLLQTEKVQKENQRGKRYSSPAGSTLAVHLQPFHLPCQDTLLHNPLSAVEVFPAIAIHPTNENIVYTRCANGGAFTGQ
jgi:hypothetical protein